VIYQHYSDIHIINCFNIMVIIMPWL